MNPSERRFYLFTYDIGNPKRLRKVFKTMTAYGMHRQLSVFICELTAKKKILLLRELRTLIHPQEDQILFVPLCGRCVSELQTLGQPLASIHEHCLVL